MRTGLIDGERTGRSRDSEAGRAVMNPETFNMSIRKFLKSVGVQSQREIEGVVEKAIAVGRLKGGETLPARMTLTIDGLALTVTIDGRIALE